MGQEYKKNYKRHVGRPNIIGQDIWEVTGTVGQAPAGAAAMADRLGATSYEAGADASLEGVMVQATGVLGAGRIGVELQLDGATIASGSLYAGGPGAVFITAPHSIASGQVLTANVSVEQGLDAGQVVRAAASITVLEYPERA